MEFWNVIWKSVVLGTVQGLTEFLPVSSSGHLLFLHKLLGEDFGGNALFFDIMLHFGTLIPVVIVFRRDILALFQKPFKTLLMLLVATIPAGVVGLLFNDKIDAVMNGKNGLLYLALCFSVTAALLLVCELVAKKRKQTRTLGWRNSVPMGLMQAVALFPGISRSGSTIVAGVVSGARAEDVTKFSFLMSIPVILGSALVSLKDVIGDPASVTALGASGAIGVVVGVICAAVSGFFAVKVMLKVIRKANYKWFGAYLIFMSLTCVWLDVLQILPLMR